MHKRFCTAFVFMFLGACTTGAPPRPADELGVGGPTLQAAPNIDNDWRAALQAALEGNATSDWRLVASATAWSWPEMADYRLYLRARALESAGRPTEAAVLYAQVVSEAPLSIFVAEARERAFLTTALAGQAKEVTAAVETWAALSVGYQDAARRRYVRATVLEAAGRFTEAVAGYRAIRLDYPASSQALLATTRLKELESRGLQAAPWTRTEQRRRAEALLGARAYAPAFEAFVALMAGAPIEEQQELLVKQGLCKFALRDYRLAQALFQQALRMHQHGEIRDQAQYYLAHTYSRLGDPDRALKVYAVLLRGSEKSRWVAAAHYKTALIYLQEGDDAKASQHFQTYLARYPKGESHAEALWGLAWAQYNRKQYAAAATTFARRAALGDDGALAARYWYARALERSGQTAPARKVFTQITAEAPLHYYGLLASARAATAPTPLPLRTRYYPTAVSSSETGVRYHLFRGETLAALGRPQEAEREFIAATQASTAREPIVIAARALVSLGRYNAAQRLVWAAFEPELLRAGVFFTDLWELAYPFAYANAVEAAAREHGADPSIVLALMREESRFRPDAVSAADAYGLLQLILPTARRVAQEAGLRVESSGDLYKPELNITLGTRYIRTLIEAYDRNLFLALAGYNSGPRNVNRWLAARNGLEMDEFVEHIPFTETRNYVKKVTTSLLRYKYLYTPESSLATPFLAASWATMKPAPDNVE